MQSNQSIWNGQLNHTYVFNPDLANQFMMSAFYYTYPFGPANVLHHTSFAAPQNDSSASRSLGIMNTDVVAPTSPYGSFGSPVSGRVMVVSGTLTF